MHVLIIKPTTESAAAVVAAMKASRYNVSEETDTEEAQELARLYNYDLIVDTGPITAGWIKQLRHVHKIKTPLLVISETPWPETRTALLDAGADDVVSWPVHTAEIMARTRALVRRAHQEPDPSICIGPLEVRQTERQAYLNGQLLRLTGKEYAIIEIMAMRREQIIGKQALMDLLYGGMDEPELKVIDVFICKLRQKLGAARPHLETVWGRGYRLTATPAVSSNNHLPFVADQTQQPLVPMQV